MLNFLHKHIFYDDENDGDDDEHDDNLREVAEVPVKVRHCQPSKGDISRYTSTPKVSW